MLLLGAGACSYTFAQAPVDRMDQIVRAYSDNHQFMGSVLVVQGDKMVFEKSYGDANLEWNIPDDSLTKFRIGSMTKQFTAASILLLEERGKLSTDDYLKKYMPDAPAAWEKITIYNLLTHTSGIPSFTSFPDYRTSEATRQPLRASWTVFAISRSNSSRERSGTTATPVMCFSDICWKRSADRVTQIS